MSPTEVARQFSVRLWGTEHGLRDSRVHAIQQTRDGLLWLGTQNGLVRFDGLTFHTFNRLNTPALTPDDCQALAECRQGHLWIAVGTNVVRKTGNQFVVYAEPRQAFAEGPRRLVAARHGGVWVATDSWVVHLAPETRNSTREPVHVQGLITGLVELNTGELVVSTMLGGVVQVDPLRKSVHPLPGSPEFNGLAVPGLQGSGTGDLWAYFLGPVSHSSEGALDSVDRGWLSRYTGGKWQGFPDPRDAGFPAVPLGEFLTPDLWGNLWMPSQGNGLRRLTHEGEIQYVPLPLEGDVWRPIAVSCDREGTIWVGTESRGLQKWMPKRVRVYTGADGLPDNEVWTICEAADGSLWVGTESGVGQFRGQSFISYPMIGGTPEAKVRAIAQDAQGTIWFGTMRALHSISGGKIQTHELPGPWMESKIRVLHPARDGGMWVGTARGLNYLKGDQTQKFSVTNGLPAEDVRAVLEGKDGGLWVGTYGGGLCRLRNGVFQVFSATNALSNENVWALHEDEHGVLWAGTGNGLNRIVNGRVSVFGTAEGLPDTVVNSILEDDRERLWIGCDKGIYWVWKRDFEDVAQGRAGGVRAVLYSEPEGLLIPETNGTKSNPAGCRTRNGKLWFPTPHGVAVIDPARAVLDEVEPEAVIDSIRANGKLVAGSTASDLQEAGDTIPTPNSVRTFQFPPGGARVLEFRFTANSFRAPERVTFKYRLLGLSEVWIEGGVRYAAHYTDVRPGKYQFQVRAINHLGIAQAEPTTIAFGVAPFYYETRWFQALCAAGLVALVGFGVHWRTREVRRAEELQRVTALCEQRRQIARDIHDELGAALTHIARLSNDSRANLPTEKVRAQTREIACIAEEAVDHIGEIVWSNNPEYDTLVDLAGYLREYAARFFADSSIKVELDFPASLPGFEVRGLFRRHVLLWYKEALQNVAKHSGAQHAWVSFAVNNRTLSLRVADDGRGFSPAVECHGNGLRNLRERMAILGGRCDVRSILGQGTEILGVVNIPQ